MANMIPLLTNPTWSSLLRNNAALAFCYVCVDEPFTLDFDKSYLLQSAYTYHNLTNRRN
ncbi:hypothetical protein T4D_3280 [Trichinella pseudospiralis]|uniref:Uncharacterized protein n=1 Tax=Trichinella pseudospiralis TaxID=6337 RepID=A0A0V1DU53_TRIPS|nr:hypothetical protein T4D_3280 [Trichinella pseudospiralis]